MAWARRNFDTTIVSENDGTLHDQFAYPLTAFRELIANALVHRDLDNWSAGRAVEVRLRPDRLVIANLGQYVHSPESGLRVIEAVAAASSSPTPADFTESQSTAPAGKASPPPVTPGSSPSASTFTPPRADSGSSRHSPPASPVTAELRRNGLPPAQRVASSNPPTCLPCA